MPALVWNLGPGTDLTVGLLPGSIWVGGGDTRRDADPSAVAIGAQRPEEPRSRTGSVTACPSSHKRPGYPDGPQMQARRGL